MDKRVVTLDEHLGYVRDGSRVFENVFQSMVRMIQDEPIEKAVVNGKRTFDFMVFRKGSKHIQGMHDVLLDFVSYVKDAAEGGSSREMAYALIGEPGNGKTFFVDQVCALYRDFISRNGNGRYTFRFKNLDQIGTYGKIRFAESQTYEDPMILAMNLFDSADKNKEFVAHKLGLDPKDNGDQKLDILWKNYRPLGACSAYILNEIKNHVGSDTDIDKILQFVDIIPVPINGTFGTLTGKYSAKDKITSSGVDLLGDQSMQRLLCISDTDNPYIFDIRSGALARVGGGGIHFADEIFKNKPDLLQIYLDVIQNRVIDINGYKWPLDTLIIATSNTEEFHKFKSDKGQGPIVDRCCVCYVGHNTDYKIQLNLTKYAIGNEVKTTFDKQELHTDPNLVQAASVTAVLTRLPVVDKLDQIEMLKLCAGEVADEKSPKALIEVIDKLNSNPNITKRFGQSGLGQRNVGRVLKYMMSTSEANEGKCMWAGDAFRAFDRIILDYVDDPKDQAKFKNDLKIGEEQYRKRIEKEMFNAYMDDPDAIKKDVLSYVNMIVAGDENPEQLWMYKDPQTQELKSLKVDPKYIDAVEQRLGKKTEEQKKAFRTSIRKVYSQKLSRGEDDYDFMDNHDLVQAVCDVVLKSDINGAGSLVGALANPTNQKNLELRNRMVDSMINNPKLGYCNTCALKTIEYFCTPHK